MGTGPVGTPAVHPVDALIIAELPADREPHRIAVLDDPDGSVLRHLAGRWPDAQLVSHHDSLLLQREVSAGWVPDLGVVLWCATLAEAIAGADLIVGRLPRATDAVAEWAELAATSAAPNCQLVGGARTKHLAPSFNKALGRGFQRVWASLGRHNSRVLHAAEPRPSAHYTWPRSTTVTGIDRQIWCYPGVFAAGTLDRGTDFLLRTLGKTAWVPGQWPLLDLGCGSGIIATWCAQLHDQLARSAHDQQPHDHDQLIIASDISAAAVAATRLTAPESVRCERAVGLENWGPESLGTIITNPPFHVGAAKDSTPTLHMIRDAATRLKLGGELIMVFNAHLPYLTELRRVGPSEVLARNREFVVTRTLRRG